MKSCASINILLTQACQLGLPVLEAKLLLMQATDLNRTELITQSHIEIEQAKIISFEILVKRRLQGEPIAYLLGYREFFSLNFLVSRATLIPRPETECLVEQALKILKLMYAPRVLDLGTGCGAIAITLAKHLPQAKIVATDLSSDALAIAKKNAQRLLSIPSSCVFRQGNWWQALTKEDNAFDLIVSNPPYIAANDPHLTQGDLLFEPTVALTDQRDGLHALRQIINGAGIFLRTEGHILLEHGYNQAEGVENLLKQAGFINRFCYNDYAGIPRISGGDRVMMTSRLD